MNLKPVQNQTSQYEEWAREKVKKAMQQFEANGSNGVTADELHKRIFAKLKELEKLKS